MHLKVVLLLSCLTSTRAISIDGQVLADPFSFARPIQRPGAEQRNITEYYFTQKVDHFDILDNRTWQQRYFINDDYYVDGGPVFLFLGGEFQCNGGFTNIYSFMGRLAYDFGALAIELEHRYYGVSFPVPDLETENLQYMTVDQALEDAAVFAAAFQSGLDLNNHWVVFGVSYSAALAGWARVRYPHIFHAAYSSSGPVVAKIDFFEYAEGTGYGLWLSNPECPVVLNQAITELQQLIAAGGDSLLYINRIFYLCDPGLDNTQPKDIATLNSMIANVFGARVQYAGPDGQNFTCEQIMNGPGTPLENIADIVRESYPDQCLRVDHDLVIWYYRNITIAHPYFFVRQLLFQMCTELGWFYSLSSPNQPFGQLFNVDYFTDWCYLVFGEEFTVDRLQAGVDRTNLIFGGQTPDVIRVLYMHGSLDQYFKLGVNETLGPDTPLIVIEGGSHSWDMSANATSDPPELVAAREEAQRILGEWLALP